MAWHPFWPKYLKDTLGASTIEIGLISGVRSAQNMIFALPGGLLADKYGRKKVIVYGTFLNTFSPVIYFLAPSWHWIMVAAFFEGMTSIYMPAFTAMVADSMPAKRRGAGYGVYSMITSFPSMVSPLIGGIVMDNFGYTDGLPIFLILQVFVSLAITYVRWKLTEETVVSKTASRRPMFSREVIFSQEKPIKVMLVVAVIGSFSARLVMDFMNLYALDVVKISNTQLGLISTGVGLLTAVLALPGGMLSDKYGRKNNIMLARVTNPLTQWALIFATDFPSYALTRYANVLARVRGEAPPYPGNDAELFAAITGFDAAYGAYAEFQQKMERYWALRWIRQEGLERLSASVLKGDVLRIDGMPFITRLPGLPELPRGQPLELDVVATHLIDLTLEARVRHVLGAQSAVDDDDEALAGDDGASGTATGPLETAVPAPPSAVPPAA